MAGAVLVVAIGLLLVTGVAGCLVLVGLFWKTLYDLVSEAWEARRG